MGISDGPPRPGRLRFLIAYAWWAWPLSVPLILAGIARPMTFREWRNDQ